MAGCLEQAYIDPKELMRTLSVESLNETADQYYRSLNDPTPLLAKPFANLVEAPEILQSMGLMLSGLRLGKTMTVLEFAAGPCWLSRFLHQLQCQTIACDVSETALNWGRKLFEEHPVVGKPVGEPRFLRFDGRRLDLPNQSVDRIVCHDGFHHVPNQEEVIAEMARVLKPGGIAAFSEPGRWHSRSPRSQSEMRHFQVLENDIVLEDIFAVGKKYGFTDIRIKAVGDQEVSLAEYRSLIGRWPAPWVRGKVMGSIRKVLSNKTVFFLYKGKFVGDSRSHEGLAHEIASPARDLRVRGGMALPVPLRITNTGESRWLTTNTENIGVVHVGLHLYDERRKPLSYEFARYRLPGPMEPQDRCEVVAPVRIQAPGRYLLAFDLVAEEISWFETLGSRPFEAKIEVTA